MQWNSVSNGTCLYTAVRPVDHRIYLVKKFLEIRRVFNETEFIFM